MGVLPPDDDSHASFYSMPLISVAVTPASGPDALTMASLSEPRLAAPSLFSGKLVSPGDPVVRPFGTSSAASGDGGGGGSRDQAVRSVSPRCRPSRSLGGLSPGGLPRRARSSSPRQASRHSLSLQPPPQRARYSSTTPCPSAVHSGQTQRLRRRESRLPVGAPPPPSCDTSTHGNSSSERKLISIPKTAGMPTDRSTDRAPPLPHNRLNYWTAASHSTPTAMRFCASKPLSPAPGPSPL